MIFGRHINKYYLMYFWLLFLGSLSLAAVDYIQLEVPKLYGMVIDGLDPNTPAVLTKESLVGICYRMLVIIAVMVTGRFLWRMSFFGAAVKMEAKMRGEMFDRCCDLSQQFYQSNKVGGLMSLFTNDLETVSECFGNGILMLFDASLLGGMAIYKMARLNGALTLFSLIPMAFMCGIGAIIGRYMQKKWRTCQETFSELSDYSQESFSGIAVVKAFVREFGELISFRKINRKNEKANVDYTKASVLLNIFVTLFVQSVICVILGYGGYLAYKGVFSVAELIMFVSYFNAIVWPVMAVSMLIEMTSRGRASLERINGLLDTKPDVCDREGLKDIESIKGDIEFKNLTFRYPGAGYDALKNVSFKIKAGENVGIIGKTGSGKTTIVDLLLRTYNVPDGTVFADGRDVNTIPIKTVRKYSAYVPQDNFLFSDTIGRNIAFSSAGKAEPEAIKKAAVLAAVDDNISEFTEGYSTMLGERGVTVSGGQKQRISIARALLKDASILILDDSLSAVDVNTEKTILGSLNAARQGKTTILISHRVSSVEKMDKIIFIDDGEIVDAGSHGELYARCAGYRRTADLQRLEDEIGGVNA